MLIAIVELEEKRSPGLSSITCL